MITIQEYLLTKSKKHANAVTATDNTLRSLVQEAMKERGKDADLNFIDTSQVTNMYALFEYSDFCGDISGWDVSRVTSMDSMFHGATAFNCDISDWDVRSVTNFSQMFESTETFNQPIGKWKTEKALLMTQMFYDADKFDQDLSSWQVDKVRSHYLIFSGSAMGAKRNLWPKFND